MSWISTVWTSWYGASGCSSMACRISTSASASFGSDPTFFSLPISEEISSFSCGVMVDSPEKSRD